MSQRTEETNGRTGTEAGIAVENQCKTTAKIEEQSNIHVKQEPEVKNEDTIPKLEENNQNQNIDFVDVENNTTRVKVADYSSDSINQDEVDSDEEEFYKPPEPDYSRANKIPFRKLCETFERVWSFKKKKASRRKTSKDEILETLLPKSLLEYLKGGSPFPFLRLMVPDLDTLRPHLGMKELSIGKIWGQAIGLTQMSGDYKKITKFTDPIIAGPTACGDLSMAVFEVMLKRFPEYNKNNTKKKCKVTIEEMNDLLDELAMLKQGSQQTNASSLNSQGTGSIRSKQTIKIRWVEKLLAKKLSPLEHKWIVRILLQKLELGVGSDSIINYFNPLAQDLYAANKNIRTLCATLCDKEYIARRKQLIEIEKNAVSNHNRTFHLPKSNEPATLNSTIAPMLSMRTSFEKFLLEIQERHKKYIDCMGKDDPLRSSLAMRYPTFSCEIKMDGERILSHIKKGIVKMQTRNSVWYSQLYSPVLGPSLRQAIQPYDVDVILDGEVISWDNLRKEIIPFGVNRGVAKSRRDYMRRNGLLDERDLDIHDENDGVTVMTESLTAGFDKNLEFDEGVVPGKDIWLKYVVFDILYLGGPDASKVMKESFDFLKDEFQPSVTGSLLNLDLWKRRRILQKLLTPQDNVVELVETTIIRSDGQSVDGATYFNSTNSTDHGYSPMALDSINLILDGGIPNFQEIDKSRLQRKPAKDLDSSRSRSLNSFYSDIVEDRQQEGLIFKDLSTPYGLGTRFRNMRYWFKLKDDYNKSGQVNDLDFIVIGGRFATGMRSQGLINQFLLACLDSDTSHGLKYMPIVSVNGQSTSNENLRKLLTMTGFFSDSSVTTGQDRQFGKWFKLNYGTLPDFISERSFQNSEQATTDGWKFKKQNYPDLWIRPEDSFVLTINSGEITSSSDYSAGVVLRFPRISKIRAKGFEDGPKPPEEIESVKDLHDLFYERQFQQQDAERESQLSSSNQYDDQSTNHTPLRNQFATMEQALSKGKTRKKRQRVETNVARCPKIDSSPKLKSTTFGGYNFVVLDGTYKIDANSLDGREAASEGWFESAFTVRNQQDVINFIQKHGGQCQLSANHSTDLIIGGSKDDARVANYRRSIDAATIEIIQDNTKQGQHLRKIIEIGGVIKWTFLYATLQRLQGKHCLDNDHAPSQKKVPLIPSRHDFLIMSNHARERLQHTEDIYGLSLCDDSNLFDFKRAMYEVKRQEQQMQEHVNTTSTDMCKRTRINESAPAADEIAKFKLIPWQYKLDIHFTDEEKTLILGPRHKFSSMSILQNDKVQDGAMVLYPDIFQLGRYGHCNEHEALNDILNGTSSITSLGNENLHEISQNSEVASVLPLAKAMGAKVTPHLHYSVTHILCNIKIDTLHWSRLVSLDVFNNKERGLTLHDKLSEMNDARPISITLVSPEWIRMRWCSD